jgi:Sec-independent protein translocase protein TatA
LVLFIFGPSKLPKLATEMGNALRSLRKASAPSPHEPEHEEG